MVNVILRRLSANSSLLKPRQQGSIRRGDGTPPKKLFQRVRPRFGKISSAFQKFMGRAFKRASARDPLAHDVAVPVDTITEIDYPLEAEMMFADQPGPAVPNEPIPELPFDPYAPRGDAACPVIPDEPALILSSLSRYTETRFAETDVSAPLSLELVTTVQLLCTKPLPQSRTLGHVGARSIPSTKQGASQDGYVPYGCDVWICFYIFPHVIIGIMILPSCRLGVIMWRYIRRRRASEPRTYPQSSPRRNPGVKRHEKASPPHPNSAKNLLESPTSRTGYLTGPELMVTRGREERTVTARTPRAFRTSTRPAMRRLRSTWKNWSDTFTCMWTAQLLSLSVQILSIFLLWNVWA